MALSLGSLERREKSKFNLLDVSICTKQVSSERERRLSNVVEDALKVFSGTNEASAQPPNSKSPATIEVVVNHGKNTIPTSEMQERWVQPPSTALPTRRLVSQWERNVLIDRQTIASSTT